MALLVNVADVQAWLNETILKLADGSRSDSSGNTIPADTLPEANFVQTSVVDRLAKRFDTSSWVDRDSTPVLVRTIIAQLIAAYRLKIRLGTAEDDSSDYANRLERVAWGGDGDGGTLGDIMAGRVILPNTNLVSVSTQTGRNVDTVSGYGLRAEEKIPSFTMDMTF